MANINQKAWRAFEHGGVLKIGSDTVLSVVEGTVRWVVGGRTHVPHRDRGVMSGVVYPGNELPTTVAFDLKLTDALLTGTGNIRDVVEQTVTTGKLTTLTLVIDIPGHEAASTGDRITFAKCVLDPQSFEHQAGGGDDYDTLRMSFTDYEKTPAFATY